MSGLAFRETSADLLTYIKGVNMGGMIDRIRRQEERRVRAKDREREEKEKLFDLLRMQQNMARERLSSSRKAKYGGECG